MVGQKRNILAIVIFTIFWTALFLHVAKGETLVNGFSEASSTHSFKQWVENAKRYQRLDEEITQAAESPSFKFQQTYRILQSDPKTAQMLLHFNQQYKKSVNVFLFARQEGEKQGEIIVDLAAIALISTVTAGVADLGAGGAEMVSLSEEMVNSSNELAKVLEESELDQMPSLLTSKENQLVQVTDRQATLGKALTNSRSPTEAIGEYGKEEMKSLNDLETHPDFISRYHGPDDMTVDNDGNLVEINHGGGYATRYAHCKELLVEVGAVIEKGQVIAKMGSTGRSTGPHVHYEVLKNGKTLNPKKFIHRASR